MGQTQKRLDNVERRASRGGTDKGSTAARDALYPPSGLATADQRVAFAAFPRFWFNTDKGWWEQYFAAYTDAGAGPFSKAIAGWAPALGQGYVPLRPTAVSASGGTASLQGGMAVFSATAAISLDGVFTTDFDHYKVVVTIQNSSIASNPFIQFRIGGVTQAAAASYGSNWTQVSVAGALTSAYGANTYAVGGTTDTNGGRTEFQFMSPMLTRAIYGTGESQSSGGYRLNYGFSHVGTTPRDGIRFGAGGSATFAGQLWVYGLNNY
jgi:hypothetical protein